MATKLPKNTKALELGVAKLSSSGLSMADAQQLGIKILDGSATTSLHDSFRPLCSLQLPYYGPSGEPISDWPKGKPFYRLRYLEVGTDFTALAEEKSARYVQEPKTLPVAYYPKNQTWGHIIADPRESVIITEGEFKAAKACKEGFPTIGIGGVYNWRSPKAGLDWLPSLDYLSWPRRKVYIVFDSDYQSNENVCLALKQLADRLHNEGAFVHLVTLPTLEGFDKIGLDDFLTFAGTNYIEMFEQLLLEAVPLGLTSILWQFNTRYVYVQDPGLIMNQVTRSKISPASFKDHLEATATYQEKQLGAEGKISYKAISASAKWLKWPLRKEVGKLTYAPGKDRFIVRPDGQSLFNIWPGWGVTAKKGDVKPFLKLIEHIFTGVEEQAKRWFLSWCAYPIQHPGTKMFSSAVLHGIKHGTGKSLVGYTLGKIYGANFTEISQMDLHNSFNEWAEGKQFVMGDDVTGSNKRQDADLLKKLITQRELRVNGKYMPTYVVPDCVNYFFTANHPDSFFLEDDDRRFFIAEVQVGPLDEEFYMEYGLWLDTGGAEAVFHYLSNYDVGHFNPTAPAFKTTAKERMIANVQSDLAGWVRTAMATPDHVLRVGAIAITKDLFTSKELLNVYDPEGRTGTTANGLGRELARAGVRQVAHGKPLRLSDGSQARYYAVRNAAKWLEAQPQALVKHLETNKAKGGKF